MSFTLRDSYETGAASSVQTYGANWRAQSFTTTAAYTISRASIYCCRTNTAGTLTASIRAVNASHLPTGADLCVGTLDTAGHSACPTAAWAVVDFTVPYALSNATEYALVVRCTAGDSSNRINWTDDTDPAGYAGGIGSASADSGANWSAQTWDLYFRTYDGNATVYVDAEATIAGAGSLTAAGEIMTISDAAVTITGVGSLTAAAIVNLAGARPQVRMVAAGNNQLWYEDI